MNNLLYILIVFACICAALILRKIVTRRSEHSSFLDEPSFSRRQKRPTLDEGISVAMSAGLKEELIMTSGNQQSKYVRASLRLALPVLKAHPMLVDILDEE
ncbi:hypothetical protein [Maridesulfovibrio bastinii]|uniref:hypothetical protein n=1 Tax=Maridesulfovibrio bastinii TaxID=47157 RepID=UPI0003F9B467|nr:hypothetical protein [Maridesulfovibrio bastinii]